MEEQFAVLEIFHPAVRRWFRESFTEPTPPQTLGWPPIARGENTLILAPTGSGKTLAAFLFAIDDLVRQRERGTPFAGVNVLYLSPLKALAADIERNLDIPLAGIKQSAAALGLHLPEITAAVRTGDTPAHERQRMVRRPPNILITTPESLHLLLTSPRARGMLQTVRYVIVDEIHAICDNKRGSFLTLLLERLEDLTRNPFVRIGLSATQRPLDQVARFLGGYDEQGTPRPVTIIDAGMRKELDLEVSSSVEDMAHLPLDEEAGPSIWPAIYDHLFGLVEAHRSTLIFANNRRTVERIASELNKRAGYALVNAHHGSVSKEHRHQIEADLKAGRLPALVATGSLELGIDMGAIDLVCQVESPHSVARGLQRVGRAGHLYHSSSKGRLIPKTREDLLEIAALARAMRCGDISAVHIPHHPLDVLAQQVVATVAVEEQNVDDLYATVRRAAPYHTLSKDLFLATLDMLAGGYRTAPIFGLTPRISWDRVNNILYPLPGSRHVAITNAGAIPDTGQYPVFLEDGKTRLGELDEEFIYERRVGETILLGTGRWQILEIENDRVVVAPSAEKLAQIPFWKGEGFGRDVAFGRYLGGFIRECEGRLADPDFEAWLGRECSLDPLAAKNLSSYLKEQRDRGHALPNDCVILLDAFRDALGEAQLAVLSPYGRAFHLALLLAAISAFRKRASEVPLAVHSDAGILFKLGRIPVNHAADILRSIRPEEIEALIMEELETSSLFGLRFRQNAARALLLPRLRPGRRTPLWLQRLRARDLLALAREHRAFPILTETYREVMQDDLPLEELKAFLGAVAAGEARFVLRQGERPSPFAASLLFDFTAVYLYEWDEPKPLAAASRVDRELIGSLLGVLPSAELFDEQAITAVEARLQGLTPPYRVRNGTELVELVRRIGDLTEDELAQRATPSAQEAVATLLADARIVRVELPGVRSPVRFIAGEDLPAYTQLETKHLAFLIDRYVRSHASVSREQLLVRYPVSKEQLDRLLSKMDLVEIHRSDGSIGLCHPQVASGVRRLTLSRRRQRIEPAPPAAWSSIVLSRQFLTAPSSGAAGLHDVLSQLAWLYLPATVWPRVLASRVSGHRKDLLEMFFRTGEFIWRGMTWGTNRCLAFGRRDEASRIAALLPQTQQDIDAPSQKVFNYLRDRGASFLHEIAAGLKESPSQVAEALWTLMWSGHVTNDSLAPVWAGRPQPALWRAARRYGSGWAGGTGRWSLLPQGDDRPPSTEEIEAIAQQLLARYGLLLREILSLEAVKLSWGALYPVLSRLEWQGAVARGLFVSGLSGAQFALPSVVDGLSATSDPDRLVLLNTCDPANLYGPGAPFPFLIPKTRNTALRRHPKNFLLLQGGTPVLAIEALGRRLTPLADLDEAHRRRVLRLLPEILDHEVSARRIRVAQWDGKSVITSPAGPDLEALGFIREDTEMIFYRGYGNEATK
jgi:ATP-dependent Lhr-like helicase